MNAEEGILITKASFQSILTTLGCLKQNVDSLEFHLLSNIILPIPDEENIETEEDQVQEEQKVEEEHLPTGYTPIIRAPKCSEKHHKITIIQLDNNEEKYYCQICNVSMRSKMQFSYVSCDHFYCTRCYRDYTNNHLRRRICPICYVPIEIRF